jgi:hypothetical protein
MPFGRHSGQYVRAPAIHAIAQDAIEEPNPIGLPAMNVLSLLFLGKGNFFCPFLREDGRYVER